MTSRTIKLSFLSEGLRNEVKKHLNEGRTKLSQMPKPLQVKLRKEGLDDQLNRIQRDVNNSNLQPLFIPKEKKFKYSITYSTTTPESAEEGDYSDTGFRIEPDVDELEHIIHTAVDLGINEHWISSSEVSDYHTGEETSYALHMDGISAKEKQFITYLLKTRQSGWEIEDFYPEFNDMDEAKYNYYKEEIYRKFGLKIDQNGDIIESKQPKRINESFINIRSIIRSEIIEYNSSKRKLFHHGVSQEDMSLVKEFIEDVEAYQSNHYGNFNVDQMAMHYRAMPDWAKKMMYPKRNMGLLYRGDDSAADKSVMSFTNSHSMAKFFGRIVFNSNQLKSYESLVSTEKLIALCHKLRIEAEVGDDEGEILVIGGKWKDDVALWAEQQWWEIGKEERERSRQQIFAIKAKQIAKGEWNPEQERKFEEALRSIEQEINNPPIKNKDI